MKTYPLHHSARNNQPAEIHLTHSFIFNLVSLEALQQAQAAAAGSQASTLRVAADDHRLRFGEEDASDLRWFFGTACLMFGLEQEADLIHWRRFLHFLLRQDTLPVAETAAKLLSPAVATVNKRGRINFTWPDKEIGLTESLAVRPIRVGDDTAEFEFEWGFQGPRILVQNAAIRMLHTLAFDLDSPDHPIKLSHDRGEFHPFEAREAHYRIVNVARQETTGKRY